MLLFVRFGVQFIGVYDAIRQRDVGVMQRILDCLIALVITISMLDISCGFKAEWSEELCKVYSY